MPRLARVAQSEIQEFATTRHARGGRARRETPIFLNFRRVWRRQCGSGAALGVGDARSNSRPVIRKFRSLLIPGRRKSLCGRSRKAILLNFRMRRRGRRRVARPRVAGRRVVAEGWREGGGEVAEPCCGGGAAARPRRVSRSPGLPRGPRGWRGGPGLRRPRRSARLRRQSRFRRAAGAPWER